MTRMTTIHLSDIQKQVLAKVKASPTPQLAWEEISKAISLVDENYATARDLLQDMGLLSVEDEGIEVTEQGLESMKEANLVDEMGQLTDEGRTFADKNQDVSEPERPEGGQVPPEGELGQLDDITTDEFPMESLIRRVVEQHEINEQIRQLKKKILTPEDYQLIQLAALGKERAFEIIEQDYDLMRRVMEFVHTINPDNHIVVQIVRGEREPFGFIDDNIKRIAASMERYKDTFVST